MSETLKFGNGIWATKKGSTLAYNSENGNFKPLPFTFDRSTSATRVNKEGLIEVVSNNEPRIDFLNDSKGALLLEPSRSNLSTRSNELNLWGSKVGVAITPNYSLSPDGSINSNRLLFSANGYCHNSNSQINGTVYTISAYVKRNTGTQNVGFFVNGSGGVNYSFNLTNEWQRFEYTYTSTNASTVGFAGISGADISVYGFQFEQGSYATSYIPTQGSIGTRVAESCSGAGNDQVFNDSEGVIYVETQPFIDGDFTSVYISLSDNTTGTNFITIQHRDSGQLRVYAGNFSTIIFLQDIDMSENLKIALQYENITDFKLYVNGISYPIYSTPTNSAFVGLNTFDFKLRGSASGYWLGQVKEAKYFNTALTDQELISLTS